ncbi:metallophosphatase [Chitinophaga parva]|uniref:Metallophosphatase n=1 Tax=Chitinophaga parva TaxID=2169414 RepID=A0A2T7BG69_9BACT|nr:metallophosphoesterase [Chitinophaga parva]PUZ25282.1 metallophosphatase [Chitinophaga parva]
MRGISPWVLVMMLALDLYVFQAFKALLNNASAGVRITVYVIYWIISLAGVLTWGLRSYVNLQEWPTAVRSVVTFVILGLVIAKLIITIFLLTDDIRRGIVWVIAHFRQAGTSAPVATTGQGISRSKFLTSLGLLLGGGLFGTLVYGFSNRYDYQLRRLRLSFPNLPSAFKGLRIVQVSDIHSGSFTNKKAVQRGVDMILAQKADLILFTGDLVNDRAVEMQDYMNVFNRLEAPMGIYSTLGNHDYGDYYDWPDRDANGYSALREQNLEDVKAIHGKLGWRLLMNEHVVLERQGQQIGLLGIENWSALGHFPKYGKMKEAYAGTEHLPFKILMSHDPTHWDAEVRPQYGDVDLTLAGHTHGFQFGVEIPGLRWSPAQYVYKEWAGLYEEGSQKIYVNRGFGFLGYPGRVGILPEITVIELV